MGWECGGVCALHRAGQAARRRLHTLCWPAPHRTAGAHFQEGQGACVEAPEQDGGIGSVPGPGRGGGEGLYTTAVCQHSLGAGGGAACLTLCSVSSGGTLPMRAASHVCWACVRFSWSLCAGGCGAGPQGQDLECRGALGAALECGGAAWGAGAACRAWRCLLTAFACVLQGAGLGELARGKLLREVSHVLRGTAEGTA